MTPDNVKLNLMLMGVTEKTFGKVFSSCEGIVEEAEEAEEVDIVRGENLLNSMCRQKHMEATNEMLTELGYHRKDDAVPDVLEPWVDNWAAAKILKYLRIRDPGTYATYVKYMSEGIHTRQYGLLDQSKSMDPITILTAVPHALIAEWRRL